MTSCKTYFKRNAGILIGLVALCIVVTLNSDRFLTRDNLMNVFRQISSNMYLACSMTMILIAGGIDLSVGSIVAITGVTAGTLLNMNVPIPVMIVICLVLGALGIANMWLAIVADVGVMILAVLNAIRCLFVKDL